MSTYVDYKINLLDKNEFTEANKIATDNIVGVGLCTSSKLSRLTAVYRRLS